MRSNPSSRIPIAILMSCRGMSLSLASGTVGTGEKFDPHLHEAVGVVESDEYPDDTVVEEIQKGYAMNGRLIRPSKVKVSKRREHSK